jgi:uncharacterized membrane protein
MTFMLFVYAILLTVWIVQLSGRIDRMEAGRAPAPLSPVRKQVATSATPAAVAPAPAAQVRKPAQPERSFEETIGGHWFQWLGIGALIIALVFFLKWAFDNGIIGPLGRTLIGYVLAVGAMVAGHALRKRYGLWSLTFTGGGALASYIVTWTAFHRYGLLPESAATLLYVLTTAITCVLAGHYNAKNLAVFGILGGFFTPLLTGGSGSAFEVLFYILILDLGVLALAHMRRWHDLNAVACMGTVAWEFMVLLDMDASRTLGITFLSLFGMLYIAIPAVYTLVHRLRSEQADIAILIGSAVAHFLILINWLEESPSIRSEYDALCALLFAGIFAAYTIGVYLRNRQDTRLVFSSLSLTVLFATLAVPLHFTGIWVPVLWSIEAAVLLVVALQINDRTLQQFAWPVMAAAYFWFFFVPDGGTSLVYSADGFWLSMGWALLFLSFAVIALQRGGPVSVGVLAVALASIVLLVVALFAQLGDAQRSQLSFWQRAVQAIALIGGSYVVLFQARRKWQQLTPEERQGMTALGTGVQIVTVSYLTAEFVRGVQDGYLLSGIGSKYQVMQVGVSILWAVYGSVALILGFAGRFTALRVFSVLLLLLAVAKLTLVDFFSLGTGARVIGFTVLGVLLVAASFLYQHFKNEVKGFLKGK